MGQIIYEKISLFEAPTGSILVHSCNAQGVWGSGIAKEFKQKFPNSYKEYSEYCMRQWEREDTPIQTGFLCSPENGYQVGCLIVSDNYGQYVDTPESILMNTEIALEDLIRPGIPSMFYSNKFNSGLFKVPWSETENILQRFIDKYNLDWTVCDPELKITNLTTNNENL